MAALALIFNPVRCARRSGAARRRLLLTPFFSPSSSHPILLTLFPVLAPDTGSHRVALGGEWALGQNRPARRKGHPRCVPLNALLLFLSQTWLPPALWFCFVTDFVIVSPAAPVVCRPTLYSAFPRTLNRAVLRAGELVLKCAAGGVARCRTWAACRCLYHSARTILCRQTVGALCAFVCVIHAVHVCAGECLWSVRRVSLFMRCPCQFLSLFFRGLRSPEYVNIFNKVCMIALECARGPGVLTTSREESLEQLR